LTGEAHLRRTTVLPLKAEVDPRCCYVANVPGAAVSMRRNRLDKDDIAADGFLHSLDSN